MSEVATVRRIWKDMLRIEKEERVKTIEEEQLIRRKRNHSIFWILKKNITPKKAQ